MNRSDQQTIFTLAKPVAPPMDSGKICDHMHAQISTCVHIWFCGLMHLEVYSFFTLFTQFGLWGSFICSLWRMWIFHHRGSQYEVEPEALTRGSQPTALSSWPHNWVWPEAVPRESQCKALQRTSQNWCKSWGSGGIRDISTEGSQNAVKPEALPRGSQPTALHSQSQNGGKIRGSA